MPDQEQVTERVQDFLIHRAGQNRGLIELDNAEISWSIYSRFPAEPRPTLGQIEKALRTLRKRNIIRRGPQPLSRVVRIVRPQRV